MNILLWVLQGALGFMSAAGGSYKITHFEQLKKMTASMRALPKGLWMLVGAFEVVAGLGLILPAALKWMPMLTPDAAIALAVESALLSAAYLFYGDRAPLPYTAVMALVAGFIAYGRLAVLPL